MHQTTKEMLKRLSEANDNDDFNPAQCWNHCGQAILAWRQAGKPDLPKEITVTYLSIDGSEKRRTYTTLSGAQKFAQHWVGKTPEIGSHYAVSFDGIGKVFCTGCAIADLFPALSE